jgi:hypothetical protein
MEHLRVKRDESISQEFRRALVTWLFDDLDREAQTLQARHGAAVRERDHMRLMA